MFLWETFRAIWLRVQDDQWITNFSHLDPFNSSSVSCVEEEHMLLLLGFAPATGWSIYHSNDSPHHTHRPSLGTDVHLPSPLSLHCDYHPFPFFVSFLHIALNSFGLCSLPIFSISSSLASFFIPPATPCSISDYFFSLCSHNRSFSCL